MIDDPYFCEVHPHDTFRQLLKEYQWEPYDEILMQTLKRRLSYIYPNLRFDVYMKDAKLMIDILFADEKDAIIFKLRYG